MTETKFLTCEEVGDLIRMSADYVRRQCAAGVIPAKKLGVEWRISQAALDAFMSGDEPAAPSRDRDAERERMSARQQRRAS